MAVGSVSARSGPRGGLEVTLRLPGAPGSREERRYGVETSVAL